MMDVADVNIIDTIDKSILEDGFASVSDRYYEHKFCRKINGVDTQLQQRISFHTNRICLLSLADDHPVIKEKETIRKVNFCIDDKTDRLKNLASGKGKKGAQKLSPDSVICYIETEQDRYPIYSCIKGKLIEINENLLDNPMLLVEKPLSDGYIALLLPVLNLYTSTKDSMLTLKEYTSE